MADYNPNQFTPEVGHLQRVARGEEKFESEVQEQVARRPAGYVPTRKCPGEGALIIRGEHFFCDFMEQMHENSLTHDGWPHASRAAEAIWQ